MRGGQLHSIARRWGNARWLPQLKKKRWKLSSCRKIWYRSAGRETCGCCRVTTNLQMGTRRRYTVNSRPTRHLLEKQSPVEAAPLLEVLRLDRVTPNGTTKLSWVGQVVPCTRGVKLVALWWFCLASTNFRVLQNTRSLVFCVVDVALPNTKRGKSWGRWGSLCRRTACRKRLAWVRQKMKSREPDSVALPYTMDLV